MGALKSIQHSSAPEMSGTKRRPGRSGSSAVKDSMLPQLGDGLLEVFAGSPSSLSATSSEKTTPSSTEPRTPSTRAITPSLGAGFQDQLLQIETSRQVKASRLEQHIRQSPRLSDARILPSHSQAYPRVSLAEKTSDTDNSNVPHEYWALSTVSTTTPGLLTSTSSSAAPLDSATATPEPKTPDSLVAVSPLYTVIEWIADGTLSLSTARDMAKKHQHWSLLEALEALETIEEQDIHHIQSIQGDTPAVVPQPSQHPTEQAQAHPDLASTISGPVRAILESMHTKLSKLVDVDNESIPGAGANVHVFIDMSNIFIGFCDAFKVSRRIPLRRRIKAPRFSFSAFALVLERLRTVQKRILAGSTAGHVAKDVRTSWPKYFYQAENLGYTMNVFNRVQKLDTKQRGRKSPVDPFSDSTADSTGDDGIAPAYDVRTGEQGVDENLHLNMMDSMWDCKAQPGTIVLATGDAAEAEFSPGFFQYAIRALDAGWMLELVTWKRAISSAWKTPEFTKKYAGKFRIIYLDDFLEELQMVDLF